MFLVPADTPGVTVGPKDKKMGQEGAWTSEVTFDNVRVPESALVGGDQDTGYRAAMTSLARGRVHIAALSVGAAQRALDESVAFSVVTEQGGTAIGDFQLVQAMLADQQAGVMAGGARWCARWPRGTSAVRIAVSGLRRQSFSAPRWWARSQISPCRSTGGNGYMRGVPVERIYREVRLLRLYEGTSEIQRLILGGGLVAQAKKQNQR